MNTRRDFMATAGGMAIGAVLAPSALAAISEKGANKMKILILGGTGFLGPQIVRHAVANGHELTLFNRGRSGPDLFPDLEHIEGDRYTDLSGLEKAVADGRSWDAVVDTFTYVPKTVTDAMDVLLPAMKQYVVISTISVYRDPMEPGATEEAPVATVDDATAASITTHREVGAHYGAMKARVERAAEERFPGRVCVIRPGLICGERDTTGRYSYWPMRCLEGGTMIGPGSGDDFVQYIDVRDLGGFTVTCMERGHMGAYTADSAMDQRTTRSMIAAAAEGAGAAPEVEWIPTEFLIEHGVAPWQDMPVWLPNASFPARGRMDTSKAVRAGLSIRPEVDTARSVLAYVRSRQPEIRAERGDEFADAWPAQIRGGLSADRERAVLGAWEERAGG